MATKLKPVHPGDILLHDFMEPLALSSNALAKAIGVATPTVNEIVRGRRTVTAETALLLATYFGNDARFWLNLQMQYDVEVAESVIAMKMRAITPLRTVPGDSPTKGGRT